MAKRDNRLAARALADWAREGFREAVVGKITATYEVAPRTLWNWKKALDTDTELAGLFKERLNDILDRDWAAHLDTALAETVERLRTLIAAAEDLTAVVEAFKALSEVAITREVLRGATDAQPHPAGAETRRADQAGSDTIGPN
jgi:methyl-accepting chemotaxis protein